MENSASGSERHSSAAPLKGMRRTSRIHSMNTIAETKRAPALNIICRLDNEHELLSRLSLLITGDIQAAELSVFKARELLTSSASPYRLGKQLTEWHKRVTIEAAISTSLQEIARYESRYVYLNCTHSEHLVNGNDSKLGTSAICSGTLIRKPSSANLIHSPGRSPFFGRRAMAWLAEKRTALSDKARTSQQKLKNL